MDFGLQGRRALVGGGSSGLGRAIAETLAAEGCSVALWARPGARLDTAVAELQRANTEVVGVGVDASAPGSGAVAVEHARSQLGGLDIVVLNGGGPPPGDATATTNDGWHAALQPGLLSMVEAATAALPAMRAAGFGRVVAVLSSGVRVPIPALAYSNSVRAALMAWIKTAASAVAADGVTMNGVIPGRIATPRVAELDELAASREGRSVEEIRARSRATIPTGRYGSPAEFGAAVAYLCSAQASYQTGSVIAVDGGMIPSW
jgi:3-oxoacyl-[acyl-carrier protein] reductase